MRSIYSIWPIVAITVGLGGGSFAQETCAVQLFVRHTFGEPIELVTVEVLQRGSGKVLVRRKNVTAKTTISLPCGDHDLKVWAVGWSSQVIGFSAKAGITWLPVSLEVGALTGADLPGSIAGTLGPRRRIDGVLWVKLVELYSNVVHHAQAGTGGQFRIGDLRPAKYYFLAFEDDQIIENRVIEIHNGEHVEIRGM